MKKLTLFVLLTLFCGLQMALAQKTITGTVTDSKDGTTLPGVNVVVKGTHSGAITDIRGNYLIKVPATDATLTFSFIGYETKEVVVGGDNKINVALEPSTKQLKEVVVTAMGMTRNQRALGYAVSTVTSKQLTQVGTPNFGSALYGKAAGVRINTAPGGNTSAVSINIRGLNSLSFTNQPLIVVDGIPMRNDDVQTGRLWGGESIEKNGLTDLNPEDIENLTVLKGAAASALYGSESSNGVVVITTKKGSKDRPGLGVDFSVSHTFDNLAFAPKFQNTYGPGYPESFGIVYEPNGYYMYTLADGSTVATPHWRAYTNFGPKFDDSEVMWYDGKMRPYSAKPDNYKDLFQTGHSTAYNVSMANGGDLGNYRVSYTYSDYAPIQYGSNNNKHSFSFNSQLKVSKKLTTDFVVNYYKTYTHNRPKTMNFLSGYSFNRSEDPSLVRELYKKPDGYQYTMLQSEDPENYIVLNTRSRDLMNYYWDMFENSYDEREDRLMANMTLNFDFNEWLKLRARGGTDYTLAFYEQKVAYTRPKTLSANQGQYNVFDYNYRLWYADAVMTGNKKFGDFDLNLDLGATVQSTNNRFRRSWTKDGLDLEGWYSLSNSISSPYNSDYSRQEKLKGGVFSILNIGYKEFAYLEASARQEQASTLPPSQNSFFYPSFGGSFIYSAVTSLPTWWTFGKARASYGISGREPDIYAANNAYNSGSINGVTINSFSGNYGNDQIKPERKSEFELGLENRFFNSRLSADLTFYTNRIYDQILWLDVPSSSGIQKMLSNAAEMKNTGVELALNAIPYKAKDFNWNLRFNVGYNKNEVVSLNEGIERLELGNEGGYNALEVFAIPGRPMGDIYSLHIEQDANGNNMVDASGYYIRSQEYSYRGNMQPKAVGGIGNTFTYKNFALDFLIDFRFGGQMFSFTNYYGLNTGRLEESLEFRDEENGGLPYYIDNQSGERVKLESHSVSAPSNSTGIVYHDGVILEGVDPNGNTNSKIIRAEDYYGNMFDWGTTGLYGNAVYDNSYIKFREASLGYTFTSNIIKKAGFQNLTFSLIGRNLFYIYKTIPNIDPEAAVGTGASRSGIEPAAAQPIRSIGFMVRASF